MPPGYVIAAPGVVVPRHLAPREHPAVLAPYDEARATALAYDLGRALSALFLDGKLDDL